MRGAAIADTHLGFRMFSHTTNGRNTREVDTEQAWFHAVEGIRAAGVDLVTIAGDVVHHPRVSDHAKLAFLQGVKRLIADGIHVVIALGNHDAGRTADVLTPLLLAEVLDGPGELHVVTDAQRIRLEIRPDYEIIGEDGEDETPVLEAVSVACFPFVARGDGESYRLDPDPEADVNILLMHAAVKGEADGDKLPFFYGAGSQALDVGREAERWDVIACGDYHEFTRLHPTLPAFYSGSLERTSSNIWQEHCGKGWVLYDTDDAEYALQEVPTRDMQDWNLGDFDLPPGAGADDVNGCLQIFAENDRIEGAMVRFKIDAFPREDRQHIDWSLVREIKKRCMHFYPDIRYAKREVEDLGDRRDRGAAMSLAEEAAAFFKEDEEDVRALALASLDLDADVEDVDTDDGEEAA